MNISKQQLVLGAVFVIVYSLALTYAIYFPHSQPAETTPRTFAYLVLGDKESKACIPNVTGVMLDHGSIVLALTEGVLVLPANRHIVASLGAMPEEEGEQLCNFIMQSSPHSPTPKKNEIESAL